MSVLEMWKLAGKIVLGLTLIGCIFVGALAFAIVASGWLQRLATWAG